MKNITTGTQNNEVYFVALFSETPKRTKVMSALDKNARIIDRLFASKEFLGKCLSEITNEGELNARIALINDLLSTVRDDENHPLADIVHLIGTRIAEYEEKHDQTPNVSGREILKQLIDEHDLKQCDLSDVGTQSIISELLSGKREFTKHHIEVLAKRFNVSPEVFF